MKLQLIKTITEYEKCEQAASVWVVKPLKTEGMKLAEKLNLYLTKFTEGILDPDIAGKKPDRFISNLLSGKIGDFTKRYIITAQDRGEVIGILIALPQKEQLLHIFALHVSPRYRQRGVGSALLFRCIHDSLTNGIHKLLIDVHMNNKPAFNLYKKFGFRD